MSSMQQRQLELAAARALGRSRGFVTMSHLYKLLSSRGQLKQGALENTIKAELRLRWELRCKVEKRACRAPGVRGGPPGCPPPGLSTKGHLGYAWARAARAPWRDSVHVPADAQEVAAHVGRRDRAQSRREREPRARSRKRAVVAQARLHLRDSTRRAASRSGTRSCCGSQ